MIVRPDSTGSVLAQKQCVPCRGGVPPLSQEAAASLLSQLEKGWQIIDGHHIEKEYLFDEYRQALNFTFQVGLLAEAQGHHPDMLLRWGKCKVTLWTHKINGMTESDFIFAAKMDLILQQSLSLKSLSGLPSDF